MDAYFVLLIWQEIAAALRSDTAVELAAAVLVFAFVAAIAWWRAA